MQMYDPKTKTVTTIDTCFGTHHLNFDDNDVLWFTGGGPVEGWFDTRIYDKTKDEQKAQGWTVFVLDTNGNGKRDAYVEPDQPVDPTKDKRVNAPFYGVAPSPVDGSIWGSVLGMPGMLVRLVAGLESAGDGARPRSTRCRGRTRRHRRRASRRAAWTSTATASSGRCSRAGISPASIGASARARSTGRTPPASTAPKAGRSIRCRDRTTRARSDSASADTAYYNFVDRFDMLGIGQERAARDRQRIGSAARARGRQVPDLPRAVSDGLLREGPRRPHRRSRRAAGRARASGRPTRRARRSTPKAARGRRASW